MNDPSWMYFGCWREAGHYLFLPGMHKIYDRQVSPLSHFDAMLAPQPESILYRAAFSRLGGWNLSALSWWDRSVDTRPASNSIVFAPGAVVSAEWMLEEAHKVFPEVFKHQPVRILLI